VKILFWGDQHYSSDNLPVRRDNYPETCLDKTRQVLELGRELQIDLHCLAGDFSHVKRMSLLFLNRLISLFQEYNCPKASTIGNHDTWYSQPETVERSPLGTMFTSGVFLPKPGDWTYETEDTIIFFIPHMLDTLPIHISNPEGKKLVLVSHFFFERTEFKDNLPEDYVDKFDYILLGHDHDVFPIKQKGRAKIIRPGALTRGTRHLSNWDRSVQVAYIDTVLGVCKYIPIVCKLPSEIFSKERLEREVIVRNSKIVEELSKNVNISEVSNVLEILDNMEIDDNVKDSTKQWLKRGGII
jgi:DNA repair exonuclease SbcCD nuclease subunit